MKRLFCAHIGAKLSTHNGQRSGTWVTGFRGPASPRTRRAANGLHWHCRDLNVRAASAWDPTLSGRSLCPHRSGVGWHCPPTGRRSRGHRDRRGHQSPPKRSNCAWLIWLAVARRVVIRLAISVVVVTSRWRDGREPVWWPRCCSARLGCDPDHTRC